MYCAKYSQIHQVVVLLLLLRAALPTDTTILGSFSSGENVAPSTHSITDSIRRRTTTANIKGMYDQDVKNRTTALALTSTTASAGVASRCCDIKDDVDIVIVVSNATKSLDYLNAWRDVIGSSIHHHIIFILEQGVAPADVAVPSWANFNLYAYADVTRAFGDDYYPWVVEPHGPTLRNFGLWVSDRKYVYFMSSNTVPLYTHAHRSPINSGSSRSSSDGNTNRGRQLQQETPASVSPYTGSSVAKASGGKAVSCKTSRRDKKDGATYGARSKPDVDDACSWFCGHVQSLSSVPVSTNSYSPSSERSQSISSTQTAEPHRNNTSPQVKSKNGREVHTVTSRIHGMYTGISMGYVVAGGLGDHHGSRENNDGISGAVTAATATASHSAAAGMLDANKVGTGRSTALSLYQQKQQARQGGASIVDYAHYANADKHCNHTSNHHQVANLLGLLDGQRLKSGALRPADGSINSADKVPSYVFCHRLQSTKLPLFLLPEGNLMVNRALMGVAMLYVPLGEADTADYTATRMLASMLLKVVLDHAEITVGTATAPAVQLQAASKHNNTDSRNVNRNSDSTGSSDSNSSNHGNSDGSSNSNNSPKRGGKRHPTSRRHLRGSADTPKVTSAAAVYAAAGRKRDDQLRLVATPAPSRKNTAPATPLPSSSSSVILQSRVLRFFDRVRLEEIASMNPGEAWVQPRHHICAGRSWDAGDHEDRNRFVECAFVVLGRSLLKALGPVDKAFVKAEASMQKWAYLWAIRHWDGLDQVFWGHKKLRAVASRSSLQPKTPKTTCALLTMVHNEPELLPLWLRYYSKHVDPRDMFLFDHYSDDNSTHPAKLPRGINYIIPPHMPRSAMPVYYRSYLVTLYQERLLGAGYPCVLFTDIDEILVADPIKYPVGGLREYLEKFAADPDRVYQRVNAWEVAHLGFGNGTKGTEEPDYDWNDPYLFRQRRFYTPNQMYNKPILTKVPLAYRPGFHNLIDKSTPVPYDKHLIMMHLASFDNQYCNRRAKLHYELSQLMAKADADGGFATHWQRYEYLQRKGLLCQYANSGFFGPLMKSTTYWDNTGVFPITRIPSRFRDLSIF